MMNLLLQLQRHHLHPLPTRAFQTRALLRRGKAGPRVAPRLFGLAQSPSLRARYRPPPNPRAALVLLVSREAVLSEAGGAGGAEDAAVVEVGVVVAEEVPSTGVRRELGF